MKVSGEATVGAPAETVWAALHDQAVLVRAVPGCERLEITGPGSGRFIVTTDLTAISGTYSGQVTASGQKEPSVVELTASAAGDQGTVTADLKIRLAPARDGSTLVSYEVNGVANGAIAAVGTRLLVSAVKRLADEFLAGLDEEVGAISHEHEISEQHHHSRPHLPAALHRSASHSSVETASPSSPSSSLEPAVMPAEAPVGPAGPPTGLVDRLDRQTRVLVGAALILIGIVVGVLLGRRGRRVGSGRS